MANQYHRYQNECMRWLFLLHRSMSSRHRLYTSGRACVHEWWARNTNIPQRFGHFHNIFWVIVPAHSFFYRQFRSLYNGIGQPDHAEYLLISRHLASLQTTFFHRTSKINIDQVGTHFHDHVHASSITSMSIRKSLNTDGLPISYRTPVSSCFFGVANESFGRNKLCIHHRHQLFAEHAERRIAHVFHRREQQRKIRQFRYAVRS